VGDPVVAPLVQSVNYVQEIGTDAGLKYTRYGNTPNAERVQKRIAMLEGAEASLVLSSGMGATACAMLALLRPGDHLLASSFIYGGTCRVLDLRPISYLTKEVGLALVVDSTFASPINFRPLEHGADVVIHSATKYLNGHHDVLSGVVAGTESYIQEVLQKEMVWGQTPDPFALWLLERGLKTIDVRVRRQNDNAMRIAHWCSDRKEIKRVHYPGLADHPDHEVARAMLDGFGGMMAIELSGGGKATEKFLRRLKLISHATSLGGVDTLICEPRYSSHAGMSSEERASIGIPDGYLRISVGIEDADDIIADIEQALR
jgi:cystathionine beta-lyase/cystathionine gamma-synthase